MPLFSNLPPKTKSLTQNFYDDYFKRYHSVSGNFYDSAVAFFEKQTGGHTGAAQSIVAALLDAISSQNLDAAAMLDKFKQMSKTDINRYMVAVLNNNRKNSSFLGYKTATKINSLVDRTILP